MTPILAADWLTISINLLMVLHVIICLLLALVVLMQRPKQEGLGAAFGAGLTDQAFGARTTDVLQKGTVYLGTLFFIVTLVLAILIGKRQSSTPSMVEKDADNTEETTPAAEVPEDLKGEKPVTMPKVPGTPAETPDTPVTPPAEVPVTPPVTPEAPTPPVTPPAETPAPPAPAPAEEGGE